MPVLMNQWTDSGLSSRRISPVTCQRYIAMGSSKPCCIFQISFFVFREHILTHPLIRLYRRELPAAVNTISTRELPFPCMLASNALRIARFALLMEATESTL